MATSRVPHRSVFCAIMTLTAATGLFGQTQLVSVPLVPDRWTISQRNFKIPESQPPQHNGELVDFIGRQSFRLARGLAYTHDVEFKNGTIDVDVAADAKSRFFGVAFHVQSDDNYEVIFFRPGSSGTDQAVQYTPGLRGAPAWQLYTGPGYTATADIPRNQWIHVRIVVSGLVAKIFLNNVTEPSLVIPDLKLGQIGGALGFWGHLGGGYFSNLSITPDSTIYPPTVRRHFEPGTLTDWELSDVFDADKIKPDVYPEVGRMTWEKVDAETPGMVVINRYRRSPNIDIPEREDRIRGVVTGSKVVFAKTVIHSERDQIRRMSLGYSDDVVVFLNGKPVYAGNNELGFRQPNFLGLLITYGDAVYLPLTKGDNQLVLAVTEFFGGWGFMCKMAEQ
jgi:hypothetical protein